ncbi:hypothetical protein IE81DRAFT_321501 [Ceraceosorus guamensis]|uniref:Translocon-associated protein subunit alpha n=1 Tax=Ceraceosorus guamensis TaxID=1522189 RepID=A0A316W470_9BASI|nr:hypothetical protein IE81DRAFT_321501 [Ceraceosorus guamensis]PWN44344.1 hypothetical protein IE81DRAFT_321501 [Ceraceosorus guamensis]
MRLLPLFSALALCLLVAVLPSALAQSDDTPELNVITVFPNNPFNIAKNGQANRVVFNVGTKEDRALKLEGITGAFLNTKKKTEGQKGYVLRNLTITPIKDLPITTGLGKPLQVPFDFSPEFKPQDLGIEFRLIVRDEQTGKKHNVRVYTGNVTVVEPERVWDLQLISVYFFLGAVVLTVIYWASKSYPGSRSLSKRQKRSAETKKAAAKSGSGSSSATAAAFGKSSANSAVDDEWIPEAHRRRAQNAAAASSGDEGRPALKPRRSGRKN